MAANDQSGDNQQMAQATPAEPTGPKLRPHVGPIGRPPTADELQPLRPAPPVEHETIVNPNPNIDLAPSYTRQPVNPNPATPPKIRRFPGVQPPQQGGDASPPPSSQLAMDASGNFIPDPGLPNLKGGGRGGGHSV